MNYQSTTRIGSLNLGSSGSLGFAASPSRSLPGASYLQPSKPRKLVTTSRFPVDANADTKVRLVFEELDINNDRVIEPEGFRRVLKALNVAFSPATVEDLYERMDTNKNRAVSYSEYMNFAGHYPVLIDALYTRMREAVERARKEVKLESQREELEALNRKERAASAQYQQANNELRQHLRTVETLEAEIESRKNDARDLIAMTFEAEKHYDYAKADFSTKEKEFHAARERERSANKPLVETHKFVDVCVKKVNVLEMQLAQSRDKERQLEAMLNSAKKESQGLLDNLGDASDELARVKEHEKMVQLAVQEAQNDTKQCAEAMREVEAAVQQALARVNQSRANESAAQLAVKNAQASHQAEERNILPYRERETQMKSLHQGAIAAMEDAENQMRKLEQDLADFSMQRAQVEEDEHPLLEHEVRLREQRYNLDDRDDTHFDETSRFYAASGRQDDRRGISGKIRM